MNTSTTEALAPTVTFLFTDIEGSTRLWEQSPAAMRAALERHDAILRNAIAEAGGEVVKTTGDGMMAVFAGPTGPGAAVSAALDAQRDLGAEPWPERGLIRVRMGIHAGDADARGGDYFGPAVNRTARVMAAGHGGQILLSGATVALIAADLPVGTAVRDLGEHRLRDLERPERLFQVHADGLADEFPPLSTLDLRPNNLPTQTSLFVGRDAELRAIRERLDDPSVRLLTLTGPGGTGKTRLALRAAADQIDRFDDGVFFVDLVSAADDDAVLALLAAAVGIPDAKDRSLLDELRRHLRGRHILLVLDTFEQVTSAATLIVDLLEECSGAKVLVTSREALRVRGENVLSVPPLSLPAGAGSSTAEELGQFEAIQLFVERSRAVRADFRLTDDNAAAVAEICRRLDGLPLAIELATARMNLFTPEALRDRLGSRLKALGSGARDLPARQQTLRATIEWSYQLLAPAEQRLFELLSVFAGASIEAIEAVAADLDQAADVELDALESLSSLLDKSLLRQVEPADDDGAPRFVMLETIREFAGERLETQSAFAAAARERHARSYAELAAAATTAMTATTDADDDRAIGLIAADLDNLLIAWRHSVGRADLARLYQLRDALLPLYDARGWYHASVPALQDLLAVLAAAPDRAERWQEELTLRITLARAITLLRGYAAEAEDAYMAAVAIVKEHGEAPQAFPVLRGLASFHGFRGEYEKGAAFANEILRLAEVRGDPSMQVDGEFLVGAYTGFTGRLDEGVRHLDKAIEVFETHGYHARNRRFGIDQRVSCLTSSGFFLWHLGFPDRAVERADRGVAIATELDHPYSVAYGLFHSGFLHHWRGEPERVRDRALEALHVSETTDLPVWRALATCLLGAATSALGRPDEGIRQTADGVDQYRGLRTPPVFWPFILYLQAGAYLRAATPAPALRLLAEAAEVAGGESAESALVYVLAGDLHLIGSDPDIPAATAAYEQAYTVAEAFGARMSQLRAAARLVRIADAAARAERVASLGAIHATFTEGFATPDLIEASRILAESAG